MTNVTAMRRSFLKEASMNLRKALDETLTLDLSLNKNSPVAFCAYAIFVLSPRLILESLPNGCQGNFAACALKRRCHMLDEEAVVDLIRVSHEALLARRAKQAAAVPTLVTSLSKAAKIATLA